MRRAGDQFKKPTVRDAVIQKRYYCDHVRVGSRIAEVHAASAALVHLCAQCCTKEYRLTDEGKVITQ